jgi:hypothetical protein
LTLDQCKRSRQHHTPRFMAINRNTKAGLQYGTQLGATQGPLVCF